jgi:hypothetical protein
MDPLRFANVSSILVGGILVLGCSGSEGGENPASLLSWANQ